GVALRVHVDRLQRVALDAAGGVDLVDGEVGVDAQLGALDGRRRAIVVEDADPDGRPGGRLAGRGGGRSGTTRDGDERAGGGRRQPPPRNATRPSVGSVSHGCTFSFSLVEPATAML